MERVMGLCNVCTLSHVVLRMSHKPAIRHLMDCGDFLRCERKFLDKPFIGIADDYIHPFAPVVLKNDVAELMLNHMMVSF